MMAEAAADDKTQNKRVQRQAREHISDDDALAEARRTIEAQNSKIAGLETTATAATHTARTASASAAESELARINDREATIKNSLVGAKNSAEAAKIAWKAAREAGDTDAEEKANDALLDAKVEVKRWEVEQTTFEANKPRMIEAAKRVATPAAATADNSRSEAWQKDHPKFFTDPVYKADATDAHNVAIARGHAPNSDGYFAVLNDQLRRLHGDDHGKDGSSRNDNKGGGRERDRSSDGAPPSREVGNDLTYSQNGHNLRISRGADGKEQLTGTIPGEWVDAAKWSGMSDVDYAISKIKIDDENKRNGGRSQAVESGVYR